MTRKSGKKWLASVKKQPNKTVPVMAGKTDQETYRNYAGVVTSPELAAHRVINAVEAQTGIGEQVDVPALLETLREQARVANSGDLAQAEAMLINQATALQSLFARLTERAIGAEYMTNFEIYLRLALRSQAQCRATLEALSAIKNPPVVYAKQANISQGHQQVNNGIHQAPATREIKNQQSQLSEVSNELCQNTRAQRAAPADDPAMETVGEVYWTKDRRG